MSKPKATKAAAAKPPAEAQLSKFQKFRPERLHRSAIRNAPYNPRSITDAAKAKLKAKLKTRGLLGALIWNRTTGNLLSGHQRLACLDALEGHGNYLLDMDVVELSPTEEVEDNIFLNNPNAQGEYDLDPLAELLKGTLGLDLAATGLDLADTQVMFDDPDLSSLFAVNEPTAKVLTALEEQTAAAKEQARKQKTADRREMLKKEGGESTDDTEVFAVAMFKTREEREAFVAYLGYGQDERYVDGARLMERLEAGIPKPKRAPLAAASPSDGADAPAKAAPKAGRSSAKVPAVPVPESKPAPKAKG